jgi:hypothetical protein
VVGFVDSVSGRVRTRFLGVPDAPVSKFMLSLYGGSKGLLENSTNLCLGKLRATVRMKAQNGRDANSSPVIATSCAKK